MTLGCSPWAISRATWVWRRSWNRRGITHRGPHCRQEEPPTEGRPPQPGPVGRAKHIASDRRMLSEVLCEDVLKAAGERNLAPRCLGLRRAKDQLALDLGELFHNGH